MDLAHSNSSTAAIKPKRIRAGDSVAIVSPSWGGPSLYPVVYELGLRNLERSLGVRIQEYPTARASVDYLAANPRARADDINAAFADSEVSMILASIGGEDSIRILPFIDVENALRNPKILMGFSDTTTLLTWLSINGLVTFQGPSIMAGFAQMRHLPEDFTHHLRASLMEPTESRRYLPYRHWSEGYAGWSTPNYDGQTNPRILNRYGWRWLQGEGVIAGRLFGGCLSVLERLKETPYWPDAEFWRNRFLFLETSENVPTPDAVAEVLRDYGARGILERIGGLLFGRARGFSDLEKEQLFARLVRVAGEFGRADLTIVAELDFGHTDPQWVIPLGVTAEVDHVAKTFRLVESAVL